MYEICEHKFSNGERCQSPACRGTRYCYWHATPRLRLQHRSKTIITPSRHRRTGINFSPLTGPSAIRDGVKQVHNALLSDRIDNERAALLLHGLQIAVSVSKLPT
jgi:hypothetical protein